MCCSWLKPGYWIDLNHPEGWSIIMGGLLTAAGAVISVGVAAFLTYRYSKKHSNEAHNTQIKVDRLRRDIDALEKLWELLAYMSFVESDYAIVRWRLNADGVKEHEFHWGNLARFIGKEVGVAFYRQHAGLYMPGNIREQLFAYRGSLIGLYLRYENRDIPENLWIKLENQQLIKTLDEAYHELNKTLREELDLRYRMLSIT